MDTEGKAFLKDACAEARKWAKQYGSLAEAWDNCRNPEWMVWALNRLNYSDAIALRRFACWCVRNTPLVDGRKVWDLLTDERSRQAVIVAELFIEGKSTEAELDAAWVAARAAAWAAAGAAAGAAAQDVALAAARAAALAAAWAAAGDAAWAAQADALRELVGNPFAEKKQAAA